MRKNIPELNRLLFILLILNARWRAVKAFHKFKTVRFKIWIDNKNGKNRHHFFFF